MKPLTIRIAERTIRLEFAGDELRSAFRPALAARTAVPDGDPDLTIRLWETRESGVAPPPPLFSPSDIGARGEIRGLTSGPVFATFSLESGALSLLDEEARSAFFWLLDVRDLTLHEQGAPLLPLLGWFFRERSVQLVHAAAVAWAGRGALLLGRGGSGKSTAALACRAAGLDHVADDYALISATPQPTVHALYGTAKLNADSLSRLPFPAPVVVNPDRRAGEKALLDLPSPTVDLPRGGTPLRALVLPRVTGLPETTLLPVAPGEVLRALAPSTIFQVPGAGPATFVSLAALVRSIPGFRLEAGTDLAGLASAVSRLLSIP
jgi:hypothetical protein